MNDSVTLFLEGDAVRFTPDGRIAVVDAIAALCEAGCPSCIWGNLQEDHPRLSKMCDRYNFPDETEVSVADSESWVEIQSLLIDHLIESDS